MSKRKPDQYFKDILDSIGKIRDYIGVSTYTEFIQDFKTVDAVIRNLEIIGEAAKNLPDEIHRVYPEVPWAEIIGMRNKVLHEYFGIDNEILWNTATKDLQDLESKIKLLLHQQRLV